MIYCLKLIMKKGYIFDFDGVICDTENFHYLAWKKVAEEIKTSFSEEDAMNLTIRRRHLETRNEWFDIEIPDRKTFLNLDSLLEENPKECLDSLFSTKALSFLFYDEGQKFFKQMPKLVESKTSVQEERNILAQKELKNFYDSKAEEFKLMF